MPQRQSHPAVIAAGLVMALLLTLPVAALAIRTLTSARSASLMGSAVLSAMGISLGTTLISMLLIVAFGTPLAYSFARYAFPFKRALSILIELPIVMPPVVAGLALLIAFGRRGLLGGVMQVAGLSLPFSTAAVVLAQVFVSAPYYIRMAQGRFEAIPRELEQVAGGYGASPWQTFWRVTLPLSLRGMIAGLILSWARALGEFGATILFAGNLQGVTRTMPLLVYGALESDLDAALWAGLILIGMAIAALVLSRWLTRALADGTEVQADS